MTCDNVEEGGVDEERRPLIDARIELRDSVPRPGDCDWKGVKSWRCRINCIFSGEKGELRRISERC